jgi:hypothetical protein
LLGKADYTYEGGRGEAEDEARSWMAEVKSQKAEAKSQGRDDERDRESECDRRLGVKESRIRGVE